MGKIAGAPCNTAKDAAQLAGALRQLAQVRSRVVVPPGKSGKDRYKLVTGDPRFANGPSGTVPPARRPAGRPSKLVFDKNNLTIRRGKTAKAVKYTTTMADRP